MNQEEQKIWKDMKMFLNLMSQCTDDYIYIWNIKENEFEISPSMYYDFNLNKSVEKEMMKYWREIVYPEDIEPWKQDIQLFLENKKQYHDMEYRLMNQKGEPVWISCRGAGHFDSKGQPIMMLGRISNIEKQNKFDNVTGVLNRSHFKTYLCDLIYERKCQKGALIILDVDNFKNINEKYGYAFGDIVLRAIIDKIFSIKPTFDLYRLDGDEFAFFYKDAAKEDVNEFYKELESYTSVQHEEGGHKYYYTVSVGVSMYPQDGESYDELYSHADSALHMAKMMGKNQITYFSKEMHEKKIRVIAMQESLRDCVESGFLEFELYYQPQIQANNRKVIGAEALLRWHSHVFGEVSPVDFIGLLEESTLIIQVGRWVIEQAVRQCKKWQEYNNEFTISVNVSYVQMKDHGLKKYLMGCLKKYELNPDNFILELTESCWIPNLNFLNKDFKELQEEGLSIAIDDFGTGYSSLNYLKELPINVIKIERSFVKEIKKHSFEYIFLKSIINVAHSIHLKVCVEGIELLEEYETILPLKPDIIQGFLFGRPVPEYIFEKKHFI